jgi:hypothetical protein
LLILAGCARLASIPYTPRQTPENWLTIQPYIPIKFGTSEFILVQPSSTIFVYLLGFIALGVGAYFLRDRSTYKSGLWWGIALLFWGIGALLAGTSYQAFSYEIKCAGQQFCSWTSWWEVLYLLFSAASVDAMVVAESFSCCTGRWRRLLITYAGINLGLYLLLVLVGVVTLNTFLLSFELLLIVTIPNIVFLFVLNTWRYKKNKSRLDLVLILAWLWLGVTFAAYFFYLFSDITAGLWARGIWFSENDVLHIGLIVWMVYIGRFVLPEVVDKEC